MPRPGTSPEKTVWPSMTELKAKHGYAKRLNSTPNWPTHILRLGLTTVRRNPLLNRLAGPWSALKLWDWETSSSICRWEPST